jgi:ribosome maturation factor RimP
VNRNLKVRTLTTEYSGKLVLIDNDNLVLKTDKRKTVPLAFEDVKDARVEI